MAPPDLAREIDKAVLPFNVDLAAEELALALLARPEGAKARVGRVVKERERVAAALRSAGHAVAPSSANFLFVGPRGRRRHGSRGTRFARRAFSSGT